MITKLRKRDTLFVLLILPCIILPQLLRAESAYTDDIHHIVNTIDGGNQLSGAITSAYLLGKPYKNDRAGAVYESREMEDVMEPGISLNQKRRGIVWGLLKSPQKEAINPYYLYANLYGNNFTKSSDIQLKVQETGNLFFQDPISGVVKDQLGNPMIGVVIKVVGKTEGAVTNETGKFSLVADPTDSLRISFVGYQTQVIPVGNRNEIQVIMQALTGSLNEVVVIGYGKEKKVDLTGAISTIDFSSEQMSSRAVPNISSALAGMAPGLSVTQPSGLPGGDQASISVRGVGSLNASTNPLVIVDGNESSMNLVDPQDVTSITILKDAAAAAIYGSKASNGVILVTTKAGTNTNGKISFKYSGRVSYGEPTKTDDIISYTPDHMALLNLASENDGAGPIWSQEEIDTWKEKSKTDPIDYPNTNWWKALMKSNTTMEHHFSASGGSENIQFYSSLSYYSNDGIIPNSAFHRISFRNNLDYKVNNWLKLGDRLTIYSSKQQPATDNDILVWWQASTPGSVPKHDGKYGGGQTPDGVENAANNALWYTERWHGKVNVNNITQNIFATITPFSGLSIHANYYLERTFGDSWRAPDFQSWWNFATGIPTRTFSSNVQLSTDNNKAGSDQYNVFATYDKSFGNHNLKLLVGYNQEYFRSENIDATKMNLLSFSTPVLSAASSDPTASGGASENALRSYFGRLNYDYSSKYLFEANLRYDGSSRFSPSERWGLFPSFSGGWVISNENFFKPVLDKIQFLKLRASWGQLGNNGIGDYEWQNLYSPANAVFNGAIVSGLSYPNISNPNLTWETTNVTNIGVDLGVSKNITVELNYYDKLTKNILANIPIPLNNGGLTPPRMNSADVSNKGIEADIAYNGRIGDLSISATANISYNKNKIVKYKGDLIEPHGGSTAWTEGYPIGTFWLLNVDHIVQDQKEVDNMVANGYTFKPSNPGPGDFLYKDANGDKSVDLNDRVLMGNPLPVFNYGGSLSLRYKGFDFYTVIYGVGKWDKYLTGTLYTTQRLVNYLDVKSLLKSWTPENTNTNVPKVYLNNTKNDQPSDFFLHSASFLKIKSLQLGYTIPSSLVNRISIDKIRIYAAMENYFTFTSYPGQDPENNQKSYPIIKTVTTGIDISF